MQKDVSTSGKGRLPCGEKNTTKERFTPEQSVHLPNPQVTDV